MFVVYWCEHLRDGIEEGAKVFAKEEEALATINKIGNGFVHDNTEIRLFHLGAEIPLKKTEKKHKEVKVTTRNCFEIAKKGKQ